MRTTPAATNSPVAANNTASSLDLALVGNGTIGMLIDASAKVVWGCVPRFDGDPVFCSLLQGGLGIPGNVAAGGAVLGEPGDSSFAIDLAGMVRSEQDYLPDTAILVTRLFDGSGGAVEVTDFAPRFETDGTLFCPMMLVRRVKTISGKPVIRVRVSPSAHYGCSARAQTLGEDARHVSYSGDPSLRVTSDMPLETIVNGREFPLVQTLTLMFGLNEPVGAPVATSGEEFLERTIEYWRRWTGSLRLPTEWRDAVVRAAITLELNVFEPTGAVIAAMTTSIPEAPDSGRNWDYRYCWPRDAYFVVSALAQLGELRTAERYVEWLLARAESGEQSVIKPLYRIDGGPIPEEREAECLIGYRGMGPVRIGNAADEQIQHDVYGEAVLSAEFMFGSGKIRAGAADLFRRLEPLGENAARFYDQADAGLWELRGSTRVHTFSSVMCWAACDRLAKYAARLDMVDRARHWRSHADSIREEVLRRSWNARMNAFTASMEGDSLDASLLLMPQLGFLGADDPRFAGTVAAIERDLKQGDFVYRYVERDDFGRPENAFLVCTFWYIDALARMGRVSEARALFEKVLSARSRHGLLAEDLDPQSHELWGNFVQTYSMVGIIEAAVRLSTA